MPNFQPLPMIAALAAVAACSGSETGQSGDRGERRSADAAASDAIEVATGDDGGCAFRWDGDAVSEDDIADRATRRLMAEIERVGIENMQIPVIAIVADDADPYRCLGKAVGIVAQVGYGEVSIAPADDSDARPDRIGLPIPDGSDGPPRATIGVEATRLTWNGAETDMNGIGQNLSAGLNVAPPPPPSDMTFDVPPPPVMGDGGYIHLAPAPDAPIATVLRIMRLAEQSGETVLLESCAGGC